MDKKKIKSAIIITCMAIVLIVIVLILTNKHKEYKEEHMATPEIEEEAIVSKESKIERTEYNAIKSSVTKYLTFLNMENPAYYARGENGEQISIIDDNQKKEEAIKVLSDEYIKENSITVDNIDQFIKFQTDSLIFIPIDIKALNEGNKKSYAVKGITENLNNEFQDEIIVIVHIDYTNRTFAIEPTNQEYDKIVKREEGITIEEKNNNTYNIEDINSENITREYFDSYKRLALAKPEIAYEKLDKEYKEKKFGTLQNFKDYVEENYDKIKALRLTKYLVNNYDDYIQYIGKDANGKEYIFNEISPIDYSIILDTYTIDLPEFTEKYNKAREEIKVGYNIERFISAINDKDYKYAYNLLDEIYRKNNIPTLDDFEEYVRRNMYDNNKVEHQEVDKQGNNFIYEIKLKDANDENSEEKSMTIIMQLKEGTDFVMSFSME